MNNTKMKDLILKGKWFQTDDIRTLIARVQDFFNIDLGYLVDKLLELERLASYQLPRVLKAQQYMPTECPRCRYDFSEHTNDGYYRVNKVKFCPNCGQALEWD